MSFLVEEEDAQATLQVALAFIDACDDDLASSSSTASATASSPTSTRSRSTSSFDSPASQTSSKDQRATTDDDDDDDDDGVSFAEVIAAFVAASGAQQQHLQQAPATRPGKSKSNGDAVKRSRAKKKAETTFLREQVAQLEATLSELQRTRRAENSSLQVYFQRMRRGSDSCGSQEDGEGEHGNSGGLLAKIQPKAAVSLWLEIAVVQAREAKRSLLQNAELKQAVNKQVKIAKSLEALLGKKSSQFGLELLRDEQKQFLSNNSVLTQETGIMADLRQRAHKMNSEVVSMFAHESWMQIADSVVCSSRLKQDPVFGPVVELRMNTPLRCSVREAGDSLWRNTMGTSALVQTPSYKFERQLLTKSSYQKIYSMILDTADGSTMELSGTSYVQRFSSAHYDSYIWASAIFSPRGDEVFREKGWMVASSSSARSEPAQASSLSKTLFRGYYEVFCDDSRETEETRSSEPKARRELVLRTLGNRTRDYQQYMQNLLLDEFVGFHQGARFQMIAGMCC